VLLAEAEGKLLDCSEIETQLSDPQSRRFSQKVPLSQLIEVLDVLWQNEGTL